MATEEDDDNCNGCKAVCEPHYYYIIVGMHPEEWYKLSAQLDHLGLSYRLFGFSGKEPRIFLLENLVIKLRKLYHLQFDGPYSRVD